MLPDRVAATTYLGTVGDKLTPRQFMQNYEEFWISSTADLDPSMFNSLLRMCHWVQKSALPLIYTVNIFAIGAYYNACTLSTEQSEPLMHQIYFRRAVQISCQTETDRSCDGVALLLTQSFYLLATCQTDTCWMTLGLAIRIAQSIGLHVEGTQSLNSQESGEITKEFRRRTWYSLYVLDRLLSLQLGRPPAIRMRDCNARLPSRLDDSKFDMETDRLPEPSVTDSKTGDYFLAVINFSHVVGHVIRDIYTMGQMTYSAEKLAYTDSLDAELLHWKSQLPRWLRFDRGHTFEKSSVLKRQRNMLAIKFHNLRALIHRPYLCPLWLQRNDASIKALIQSHGHRVVRSELGCVREAQETAHLLQNTTDRKTLIEDFPWWQMISCHICASSILLVMARFAPAPTSKDGVENDILEDDVDTCLKILDALSTNSKSARLARDMLQNLRDTKIESPAASVNDELDNAMSVNYDHNTMDYEFSNGMLAQWDWQDWPSEIADSMTWSSQFVDTLDPSMLNANFTQKPF